MSTYGSHLRGLPDPPKSELEERLFDLLDSEDDRLPLISVREARAVVMLLQIIAQSDGDGHDAAYRLASRITHRLPPEGR